MNFIQTYQGDLYAISTSITWASAIIFFRLAGKKVGAISFNVFKNTLGFILMFITLFLFQEQQTPILSTNQWIRICASAFFGVALAEVFVVLALNSFGAGLTAIGNCLYAPTVMILAYLLLGQKMTLLGLMGSTLVIAAIIIGSKSKLNFEISTKNLVIGFIYLEIAHVFNALGVLGIMDLIQTKSLLWVNTFRFGLGTLMLFLVAIILGKTKNVIQTFKINKNYPVMCIASFLGPFISTLLWFAGFKYTLAGKAAIYNQLSSVFIIIFAALFLKEPLTRNRVIAIILAFIGAVIVGSS